MQVRQVGENLGLAMEVRDKLEPLRTKMTKLADRGWLPPVADCTSGPTGGSPHAHKHAGARGA
ncbi:hypothetical protein [Streptomyces sp. Isolate_219]|uniref:hypothetical protein n=1 Tax=Streptomyces sp. Isolate_219 TaxID=2950110 RepID=UPI0021C9D9B2|nr:hypothetical protein [Streptomyces sp. Isolate_219]MCR8572719.1 hypothetical protein [Streptomyces sp. Isolate_219]